MENRITRFLMTSLALLSVFCIFVFSVQAVWNSSMGANAITDIGIIYMSGISKQVSAHFGTTMELRLSQVAGLVDAVPPQRSPDPAVTRISLPHIARARGFEYLAFYTDEGEFDMIYGPQLDLRLADSFRTSLYRGEEQVGAGWDENGMEVVLLLLVFFQYFRMTRQQVRDLDEARRTAERASQVKSEFLSNMSHDIRTPMNGIMGMTAVAIANLNNTSQVRSCLKKINISSRHLLGLLNDMLDMSKIERGALGIRTESVSLEKTISGLLPLVRPQTQEKGQIFNVYTRNIPYENVLSDTVRLTQILLNLLGNAIKFTPAGGEIQLLLYQEPSPKGGAYIRTHMVVKDNGAGMSPELQEKIFEPFVREDSTRVRKAAGSGLGLTITKHIVNAMDGMIEVASAPGQGSAFHVTLDLEKTHVQEPELRLPERNVLVIDPDGQIRDAALEMLSSIGLQAEGAADAAAGLALGLARRERGQPYQIVLLDWEPPEEASVRTLRQLGVPILALYCGDWSEAEDDAQAAGIAGCAAKPLFRSALYYSLRQYAADGIPLQEPEQEEQMDFTGRRVLLAEDNELNYEIASELLQEMGMEVDWAENGHVCVDKFQQSAVNWYDIVLMDLRMPMMSGFEAAQAIRRLPRADAEEIPIIAVSADAFYDDVQRCLACGMNDHTPKPIDMGEISRLMEKYMRR